LRVSPGLARLCPMRLMLCMCHYSLLMTTNSYAMEVSAVSSLLCCGIYTLDITIAQVAAAELMGTWVHLFCNVSYKSSQDYVCMRMSTNSSS